MTVRLNTVLLLACAWSVYGKELTTESFEPPRIELPNFTPYKVSNAVFWEQFTDGLEPTWKRSRATKQGKDEDRYDGEWAVEEVQELAGIAGDKALVAKSEARHHAISARLSKPFDPANGLVLQYEVKLQQTLNCGGAYVKLLTAPMQGEFSDSTPYTIMFGPDKCGESKLHFIYRHANPITGKYTEHHLQKPPVPPTDSMSHLYTLTIHTNNTFAVSIDGVERKTGSLLEDFDPPVNPPKEIDDPEDSKPADWVDEEQIPDPDAVKPADWDEDAPAMILDEDAVKPDGWLEDEPLMIPDPEAEKPSDWDDEEDGDWAPPMVPNPRCADADGCGPWKRPQKRNPDYKGKWTPPLIDNPAYKGKWAPRRIANPDYFEDLAPYKLANIDAIGFELWTMQAGITFDNIYLGDSVDAASKIADEVWKPKHDSELAVLEATNPKPAQQTPSKMARLLELFTVRLDDIAVSVKGFYAKAQQQGIVEAVRQDRSGAIAVVMAVGGLAWLIWNVLSITRYIAGLGTPAVPQPPSAESQSAPNDAKASSSAREDSKAVKRRGKKA
ncbi:hypothetical protein LPJ78_002826 [Coemansia sp. RSA 989]|nr:calreticulin [Coemansia mojavensis]KAJ1742108.1 hypothetical protein LPJ68_002216 [Coemansia sp. RSA 1086]KAJ1750634.1 hypothetical protein LPJ79_002739 [Coemansia sp. RSA 1821]KAJ1865252.1 hypothetical protein LPJ78_002826 [Coemansia sp. RSA 989]KAJ2675571.1 hypothetical protein IWW42_000993 [Coemansia sp. RSA 1085]